jgi:hypothetical protein
VTLFAPEALKKPKQAPLHFIRIPYTNKERDEYPPGFFHWLDTEEGARIWQAFEHRAYAMAESGRKRYSARAILHVIRWETDLRDPDITFKCNNNWTPGLARLWMHNHGHRFLDFFELRNRHA